MIFPGWRGTGYGESIFSQILNSQVVASTKSLLPEGHMALHGLKRKDTPILKGYQIFHNYIREHEGLDGKTPAEACGIKIEGKNKWLTLIQNASRK